MMSAFHLQAEQVGFVSSGGDGIPALEMMGGEFCLNATCCLAFLAALRNLKSKQPADLRKELFLTLRSSGIEGTVKARVRPQSSAVPADWPVQSGLEYANSLDCSVRFQLNGYSLATFDEGMMLARLPGISHILLDSAYFACPEDNEKEMLRAAKKFIRQAGLENEAACGVIWHSGRGGQPGTIAERRIVPVVYVRDTASYVRENACGSGSLALALALREHGIKAKAFSLEQPSGFRLYAEFSGEGDEVWVGGPVTLLAEGSVYI